MAAVLRRSETGFTLELEIPYKDSMLDAEQGILIALNQAGVAATAKALSRFDADGQPIQLGATKLTSMGRVREDYQTPYGVATLERHVCQNSRGGKTHCPLDQDARIVVSSTPRFAKLIARKYAEFGAARVRTRLPAEVDSALTYFSNPVKGGRMNYAEMVGAKIPIGSGVTEAACKVLVK